MWPQSAAGLRFYFCEVLSSRVVISVVNSRISAAESLDLPLFVVLVNPADFSWVELWNESFVLWRLGRLIPDQDWKEASSPSAAMASRRPKGLILRPHPK